MRWRRSEGDIDGSAALALRKQARALRWRKGQGVPVTDGVNSGIVSTSAPFPDPRPPQAAGSGVVAAPWRKSDVVAVKRM